MMILSLTLTEYWSRNKSGVRLAIKEVAGM